MSAVVLARNRGDTHEEAETGSTDTPPGRKRLYSRRKWERSPVEPLCFQALVEPEVGHADTEPGDQSGSRREVGEPQKDLAGTFLNRKVGEQGKARAERDGDVGQPRTRRATKDLWRTARDSESV